MATCRILWENSCFTHLSRVLHSQKGNMGITQLLRLSLFASCLAVNAAAQQSTPQPATDAPAKPQPQTGQQTDQEKRVEEERTVAADSRHRSRVRCNQPKGRCAAHERRKVSPVYQERL